MLPDERANFSAKVAPEIPSIPPFLKNKKTSFWYRISHAIFQQHKRHKILSRLQHYRARRIASWKVIQDFQKLSQAHLLFRNSKLIFKIIRRYEKWTKNAEQKVSEIEHKYPEITQKYRISIAQNACLNKEKELEQEFFEKGFICEKVFCDLEDEIHRRSCDNEKQASGKIFSSFWF